ncbi:outer membrane protein assembly factor BamE (lipoprotein component of BamABCDE complex) [Paraburkholderia sp. HC6.4b]|uniref:outer membrane protein assembly factor BamE domain-containing protein n=1 Tax=unclassified Paraburkholderia TaxID=2615204 RepID=UPI00161FE048|nr:MULTISPECIES: outer membrane protein assembly factor BamE [unclassified Paraburkholderia]MBB5413487.1 outer membrane protein assembly factor BamE (lipoprotein component of BamABCDE complex) [Paraburkholderia sp. HC6.4b]MBB5455890.1 outer membrane protein assembly factor BamE (lipoprotein component of BamABCDE complex) [Paraburkholderia sp. Kb1A]
MFKKTSVVVAAVAIAVLAGCASQGVQQLKEENASTVGEKIIKGKSTRDDVRKAFGDPTETSFTDSGNELWRYKYSHSTSKAQNFIPVINLFASGADVDKKELVVFFDDNGIVKNYSMQSSKEEVKSGILPQ